MKRAWEPMKRSMRRRWISTAFDAHATRLLRYVARLVGEEAARDVVQQTFMKLWEVDPPPVGDHLAPWLYTVCRRSAIDLRRKESRMLAHQAELRVAPPPSATPQRTQAETKVEANQILAMLELLPEGEREVLRLRFASGLAYREIAEVTGKPIGTVGALMHRGIRALRRAVGEESS